MAEFYNLLGYLASVKYQIIDALEACVFNNSFSANTRNSVEKFI